MPFIDRDSAGNIIRIFAGQQREGQEYIDGEVDIYKTYQQKRAQEYPNFMDYLDAIVKGDANQQQAYINACLAVKERYPKS